MPWLEINPMDQKLYFICDYKRGIDNFSNLCERYGISRKTGYKLVNNYHENGIEGLEEKSRAPHNHPHKVPYKIRQSILELRSQRMITLGAKKIQARLKTMYPDITPPAISTINNILKQEGLVKKSRKSNRVPKYNKALKKAQQPNDLWTVDFKGQFKLKNGRWCYPLTIMDEYSRFLIDCRCQSSVKGALTIKSFQKVFKEYGLPKRIRSDNGVPFATKSISGFSSLSVWWIRLGIIPERIMPGKPQQNGKHERMHRTLKKFATRPPCQSFKAQQQRFDLFREEFNYQRPHESLGQKLPSEVYQKSPLIYPDKLPKIEYPSYFDVRRVRNTGVIYWGNGQVYITHNLKDQYVGMDEVDDGVFDIYYSIHRIGQFDIRNNKPNCVNYWTVKV